MSLVDDARDIQKRTERWHQFTGGDRVLEYDTLYKAYQIMPKIVALLEAFDRHDIGFDEHEYEGGVVLSIASGCCCFSEPVIHTEGRCLLSGGPPKWPPKTPLVASEVSS